MKIKYAILGLATLGLVTSGLSARGDDANAVPMQDLKIVQETGDAIQPAPDADELQQGDSEENLSGYYYRPYRPYYRPYRVYYRPYRPYYRPYRPYAYRPYRPYYRPYRPYSPAQPGGEQPDLQNLPGPQME